MPMMRNDTEKINVRESLKLSRHEARSAGALTGADAVAIDMVYPPQPLENVATFSSSVASGTRHR